MTFFRDGIRDSSSIRLSVIPPLIYSASAFAFLKLNGRTATDSKTTLLVEENLVQTIAPTTVNKSSAATPPTASLVLNLSFFADSRLGEFSFSNVDASGCLSAAPNDSANLHTSVGRSLALNDNAWRIKVCALSGKAGRKSFGLIFTPSRCISASRATVSGLNGRRPVISS